MPECSYCSQSFDSEDAYVSHLEAAHEDELGPIDRRRIEGDDTGFAPSGRTVVIAILVIVPLAVFAYVLFGLGATPNNPIDKPSNTPVAVGSVHAHGTINVTIAGTTLDFSRSEFQRYDQYDAFHFEPDGTGGEAWHLHARKVTLQYAMWTLGIGVTEDSVTYEGTTYRDGENATVLIEVNGDPVDPSEYVLQGASMQNYEQGDHVRIVVRTNG